jgi:hypothetical protein
LQDGGFELGTPNARWSESSTNFGTPLCTEADCGLGAGTGPYQGTWWAWFGGIDSEQSTISQTVVIPVGANTLRFQMELPVCDIAAYDTFEILVDNAQVFYTDGDDSRCNMIGYQQRSVNIAAYANGAAHTIMFRGTNDSLDISNYFVDDVALVCN